MVIPHYLYLLLKTPGLNGVLYFKGDLNHSYNCETEVIQIAAKAQLSLEVQQIARLAH